MRLGDKSRDGRRKGAKASKWTTESGHRAVCVPGKKQAPVYWAQHDRDQGTAAQINLKKGHHSWMITLIVI